MSVDWLREELECLGLKIFIYGWVDPGWINGWMDLERMDEWRDGSRRDLGRMDTQWIDPGWMAGLIRDGCIGEYEVNEVSTSSSSKSCSMMGCTSSRL